MVVAAGGFEIANVEGAHATVQERVIEADEGTDAAEEPVRRQLERRLQPLPERFVGIDQSGGEQLVDAGTERRGVEIAGDHHRLVHERHVLGGAVIWRRQAR